MRTALFRGCTTPADALRRAVSERLERQGIAAGVDAEFGSAMLTLTVPDDVARRVAASDHDATRWAGLLCDLLLASGADSCVYPADAAAVELRIDREAAGGATADGFRTIALAGRLKGFALTTSLPVKAHPGDTPTRDGAAEATGRAAIIAEARSFLASNHVVEALALCDLVLRDHQDRAALLVKAAVLMRINDVAGALTVIARAQAIDPGDGDADEVLGDALEASGRRAEALAAYDAAVRRGDTPERRLKRGSLRLKTGDEAGALEDFGAAAPDPPGAGVAGALEYAEASHALGAFENCLDFLDRLGPTARDVPRFARLRALCRAALGRTHDPGA